MNAFAYLIWTSGRNRIVALVRRARSPRHIVALLLGAAYVWWFLFRPMSHVSRGTIWAGKPVEMLATLLLTLTLVSAWVFGSDVLALAFTQAEVSMLFPAPISRRGLIGYKLYRAQIGVLINALIWVFVLRRGGTALPSPLRALSLWVLFSTLNLHRLGAALVWSALRQHGRAAVKRNGIALVVFSLMGIALVAGLVINRGRLGAADDIGAFFKTLGDVLGSFPAVVALFPMHLIVGPAFATSIGAWARAMPWAIALLAGHALWVVRSDAAFEDAALEASAERAKRRAAGRGRRSAVPTMRKSAVSATLGSAGHPAVAIVWKNLLCLRRTAQLRLLIAPAAMALGIGAVVAAGGSGWPETVTTASLAMAGMLFVFGGRLIRTDLR
ncbi:MAG: putative ABC exporter domain-containing protein, partial [Gemmatimonadales bacterium]